MFYASDKARLRRVALGAHVPLPDKRGVVAGTLQVLGEVGQARGNRRGVVDDTVAVRVMSRENGSATRRTQRRRDERVTHVDAALRKRVEVTEY